MDSKLDSGHLEPGETLEDEYDVLRSLLPEEVIGVMDQILCHEVGSLDTRHPPGRMC
jgi:N-alpha-acetyltransferase 35, NatC auxiliary subunit